jgi:hypothetical protein
MRSIRRYLIAAAVSAAVLMPPNRSGDAAPASAPLGGSVAVGYSIAFWGIPFGHTTYEGTFSKTQYSASSHFETSGIVSLFWQAVIDATGTGTIGAHRLDPGQYDSFYRRGDSRKERVKVTFEHGSVNTFADPPYDTAKYPVSDAQKREAVDPMSAITLVLTGVTANRANPCGTTAPVFDGRRRYDIEFTYLKDEPVTLPDGLFRGTAHLCQLHYRQIAGFKPKILKEGAAFPPIFGDFGEVSSGAGSNAHYVVALKLWCSLKWGTVLAVLTNLRQSGETPRG